MDPAKVVVGEQYSFTYSGAKMVGVCVSIRGTPPWPVTIRTDDGEFGLNASMIEEIE